MILTMAILYHFGLDVEQEWKGITPGSICAMSGFSVLVAAEINAEIEYEARGGKVPGEKIAG
jgi:hypothetical protein